MSDCRRSRQVSRSDGWSNKFNCSKQLLGISSQSISHIAVHSCRPYWKLLFDKLFHIRSYKFPIIHRSSQTPLRSNYGSRSTSIHQVASGIHRLQLTRRTCTGGGDFACKNDQTAIFARENITEVSVEKPIRIPHRPHSGLSDRTSGIPPATAAGQEGVCASMAVAAAVLNRDLFLCHPSRVLDQSRHFAMPFFISHVHPVSRIPRSSLYDAGGAEDTSYRYPLYRAINDHTDSTSCSRRTLWLQR